MFGSISEFTIKCLMHFCQIIKCRIYKRRLPILFMKIYKLIFFFFFFQINMPTICI